MLAVGIMSGTSLDGIDSVLCDVQGFGKNTKIKVIDFRTYGIPKDIYDEIKIACLDEDVHTSMICSLNFKIGKLFSNAVGDICNANMIKPSDLAFVASHGQTIYHQPKSNQKLVASTLQIGESSIIAYDHHVVVIDNFRVMDMAAGGEGAPLVPHAEEILYGEANKCIALQNIGGIGNVSLLDDGNVVFAFDTGPGNMVIDEAMFQLFDKKYDDKGNVAASGTINKKLLDEMLENAFFKKEPPKTTGREMFGEQYVRELTEKYKNISNEDFIATVTMFTVKTIADSYKQFILPKYRLDKVIIGGGGAHNQTLLKYLQQELPEIEVLTQEDVGYSSDAKEAIAFVILGNETCYSQTSNVISATGAAKKVILGKITPNPFRGVTCSTKK